MSGAFQKQHISRAAALAAAVLALASVFTDATAEPIKRSSAAKREFRASHPCPATDKSVGPCAGYVIDHIVPLCAGGADRADNMQWQTVAVGKEKDLLVAAFCRDLRKAERSNTNREGSK